MKHRSRVIALSTVAVGVVVLIAAAVAGKDWIREEWYIHKLEKGNQEEQEAAANWLGQMRCVRSIPVLVRKLTEEPVRVWSSDEALQKNGTIGFNGSDFSGGRDMDNPFRNAILQIGKPATFELLKALKDKAFGPTDVLRQTLVEIYDEQLGLKHNSFYHRVPSTFTGRLLPLLMNDLSLPSDTRRIAAVVLEKFR